MDLQQLIQSRLDAPLTHQVVTVYDDGSRKVHKTRSFDTANNFATGERRRIGRAFISREDDKSRVVMAVLVEPI